MMKITHNNYTSGHSLGTFQLDNYVCCICCIYAILRIVADVIVGLYSDQNLSHKCVKPKVNQFKCSGWRRGYMATFGARVGDWVHVVEQSTTHTVLCHIYCETIECTLT